jgi:hypothetical protein
VGGRPRVLAIVSTAITIGAVDGSIIAIIMTTHIRKVMAA